MLIGRPLPSESCPVVSEVCEKKDRRRQLHRRSACLHDSTSGAQSFVTFSDLQGPTFREPSRRTRPCQLLRNTPAPAQPVVVQSVLKILDTTDNHRGPPRSTDNVKGIRTVDIMASLFRPGGDAWAKSYFFERMKLVLWSTYWRYPEALHRQLGLMLTLKGHASPSIIFP